MAEQLVLITREQTAARRFQAQLRAAGLTTPLHIAPLLRLKWLDLPELPEGAALLITSHSLAEHLPAAYLRDRPAYVVGEASATLLAAKGARVICWEKTAELLGQEMTKSALPGPVLWLHGAQYAYDFSTDTALSRRGIRVQGVMVYRQIVQNFTKDDLDKIKTAERVIAPVFSAQSAKRLCQNWPDAAPELVLVAMSFAVAEAVLPAPGPIHIASQPDAAGMVDLLSELTIKV